jgi:hypothetical protein
MTEVFGAMTKLPGIFGPMASVMQLVTQYQEQNLKTYQQISNAGVNFGGSLTQMRQAAANSYMTLEEFGAVVSKHSGTLANLGGNADNGARNLALLSKSLLGSNVGKELLAMGYTTKDVNEGMLNYIAMTGGRTSAELKNAEGVKKVTDASADYLTQLDGLARLTGKSREQQQSDLDAAMKNAAFQSKLQGMSEAERAKATAGMANALALGGKGAADAFQSKIMGVAPDKAGQLFIATAGNLAGVVDKSAGMVLDGSKSVKDMGGTMKEGMRAAQQDYAKFGKEGVFAIIRQGGPLADSLSQLGITANNAKNKTNEEIDAALAKIDLQNSEAAQMTAANASLKEFGQAINGIIGPIVSFLTPVIKVVAQAFGMVGGWINSIESPMGKLAVSLGLLGATVTAYMLIQQ